MEKTLFLNWKLEEESIKEEMRYCHNCGKKVVFIDSKIRRQNANGKNIYHFAIYKCAKGHTWNKKLDIFKAYEGLENSPELTGESGGISSYIDSINITEVINDAYTSIQIQLYVKEKTRLDKLLAKYVEDLSRSKIKTMINDGNFYINNKQIKKNTFINGEANILIKL
ncbi:S4 domain-containing protein [Vallitalea okinawensis]|uniref:S4 domain-containing protein n=1 Tax=Vallitalea okinawensis TaxID=2078660 RepID=UPI000CFE2C17|nr:S4 domain-containing protein [Vallitalea okinawensis]